LIITTDRSAAEAINGVTSGLSGIRSTIAKIFINERNADARTHVLEAHVIELLEQVFEKMDLSSRQLGQSLHAHLQSCELDNEIHPMLRKDSPRPVPGAITAMAPPANSLATINCVDVTRPEDRDLRGAIALEIVDQAKPTSG